MPAKHSRNGRSARQRFSPDNALLLHSPPETPSTALLEAAGMPTAYYPTPDSVPNDSPAPTVSTLIDFDQVPQIHNQQPTEVIDAGEGEFLPGYRSPPFMQAPLPPIDDILANDAILHSPQPLPIRPRISMADSSMDPSLAGHTRSPILAREQTTLESFSRTLRTYVPSAIHIPVPRPAPSPPLVSRPVSFGSFSASPLSQPIEIAPQGGHHGYEDQERIIRAPAQHRQRGVATTVSGLARALQQRDGSLDTPSPSQQGMSYPGSDVTHLDPILWARWESVNDRRLLILCYGSGFQIWDCTNLDSVTEVLNLNTTHPEWLGGGEIVHVGVLPPPNSQIVQRYGDPYGESRPLLGVLMNLNNSTESSTLFIYSLTRQVLIKEISLSCLAATFQANAYSLVFSITNPPALQIYSPSTFKEIYTINSNALVPFAHSSVSYSNYFASKLFTTGTSNNNKGNNDAVFLGTNSTEDSGSSNPKPIFALSHRLLAYASPPSFAAAQQAQRSPSRGSGHSSAASPSTSPFGIGGLNMQMTQADLGNAALKVGGSLLSGMKTLGGIALSAAKSHISGIPSHHHRNDFSSAASPGRQLPHHSRNLVSISAPSGADSNLKSGTNRRERRSSTTSSMGSQDSAGRSNSGSEQAHTSPLMPNTPMGPEQGSYVTVIDLGPLLLMGLLPSSPGDSGGTAAPVTVAEFFTSKSQPVAGLHFSSDGCSIVVVPMNGQVVQVYQLRPTPGVSRLVGNGAGEAGGGGDPAKATRGEVMASADVTMWMYRLHRGRSQAIVNDAVWANDGRWAAIGTLRPTIHVFAVNPYGGKPDIKSHTKGKVFNANELQPSSVEISPVLRLRVPKSATSEQAKTGLSFTFIESSAACLPTSLLPSTPVPGHVGSPEVGSSPNHRPRPTNYQDILVFDHTDGALSLRRITTEVRARDQGLSVSASMSMSAAALGATSISLPGLGGAGKSSLSSSPSPSSAGFSVSSSATSGKQGPNVDINATHELVGKEAVVATWNLQRRKGWGEVKQPIEVSAATISQTRPSRTVRNYLAQAELSTFSRSPQILPRSIYLSHQFSFYSLGEDYHALIRRSQLDIPGHKIEVRKEVFVSAFPSAHGASEAFVEGFLSSSSRDARRHSGSFDEPLASALLGGLDYNTSMTSPILPMYPNGGTTGSRPRSSFRNPIPIRTIGDGMSEKMSRFRREINKVRSPHLLPRTEGAGGSSPSPGLVPLEFDEEDEDFLSRDKEGMDDSERVSEPTVVPVPDPPQATGRNDDGFDVSSGWDLQDRQAVEEEERFHDLVVPGLMDEEARGVIGSETVRVKGKAKRR